MIVSIMRVVFLSPYSIGPARGNLTTVDRIRRYLHLAGAEILVLPLDASSLGDVESRALHYRPDVVHAFHAFYCGGIAVGLADRLQRPLVITTTGSDVYDESMLGHVSTSRALARAAAIVCFSRAETGLVAGRYPGVAPRCVAIAQGVECLADISGGADLRYEEPFVLLPAALRPVKNIESAIRATEGIRVNDCPLKLLIAGGVIDREYAAVIRDRISGAPWVHWLGNVPRENMGALYRRAEVVLNCSVYEGMPNSLMEAMALGRAVLAADIPGNRSLVRHTETGWLYGTETDLRDRLIGILGEPALRNACGTRAAHYIRENHDPEAEARSYLRLYRSLVQPAEWRRGIGRAGAQEAPLSRS